MSGMAYLSFFLYFTTDNFETHLFWKSFTGSIISSSITDVVTKVFLMFIAPHYILRIVTNV